MMDEDTIVIHLGRVLTPEEYEAVPQSVIAFMNTRWPNIMQLGRDS